MRQAFIHGAAASLIAITGAVAFCADQAVPKQEQEQSTKSQQQRSASQQAPDGYFLMEEKTVYIMANEPQQHFLQAQADLARKDYRAAGEETRLAAAFLDMQAARPGDPDVNQLKQQADALRRFADQLQSKPQQEQGKIHQPEHVFARASDALARHFDALTKHDLKRQNFVAAGYDLGATANCFKNTIVWSDQKPSDADLNMISNAQQCAFKLRSNEIYRGEQALRNEQKAWTSEKEGQAEQAAAKLPAGITKSTLTGTTPAEARNDAQHAQELADALSKAIGQFDQHNGTGSSGQQNQGQAGGPPLKSK